MTLKELIKDVPIQRHVGNASTLALVELTERVPGLPKSLVLLAVQLGHGRTLSAVDDQRQRLLWRKHTDQRVNGTAEPAQTRPEAPTAAEDVLHQVLSETTEYFSVFFFFNIFAKKPSSFDIECRLIIIWFFLIFF